jgi:hypothetical protein
MAFWNWDPSNDRDFGLQVLAKSQNPARHTVDTRIRYAGQVSSKLSWLVPFLISGLRLEEQKNLKCTMAFSQS